MARLVGRYVADVCGEMTWPAVTAAVAELSRKLRYDGIERSDELFLASVVDAYLQLVQDTQEKRNAVCREIVQASQEGA